MNDTRQIKVICWYCSHRLFFRKRTVLSQEEQAYQMAHLIPGARPACRKHLKKQVRDLRRLAKRLGVPFENMYK
jgi:DNA-directed RNA polymerase subunit RPC12/RpoP